MSRDSGAKQNSVAYEEALEAMRDQCICVNLRKVTRIVTRRYDEVYADAGVRSTQTALLSILMLNGETPMGVLADELGMDKSTLSRNFKLMETRGLVMRTAIDGRTTGVSITVAGQEALEAASGLWREIQDDILKNVGLEAWEAALAVLNKLGGRAADSNRVR
jgi:DNA-binding MarR family transcriptional regulator